MDRVVAVDGDGNVISVVEIEGEAVPDYLGFYDSLLGSKAYKNMLGEPATAARSQALAIFVSAINNCLAGRENRGAMQAAILMLLSETALTSEHLAELAQLMTVHKLAGVYQLQP